jgi:hypothetical protein
MAGGDGSLINLVMKAKAEGVDVGKLICCSLPYGTGNDLCRIAGWGGDPKHEMYQSLNSIVREICLNTYEKQFNIWNVSVKFRKGGNIFKVNSKTKQLEALNETYFE